MSSISDGRHERSSSPVGSPTTPEDPWPLMESQVVSLLKELTAQISRAHDGTTKPNVIFLRELMDNVAAVSEVVADMRYAFDTAMEHPESFAISTEALMNRSEKLRRWEREVARGQSEVEKMRRELHPASGPSFNERDNPYMQENNQFLQSELAAQRQITEVDDATLDRLHGGIQRVKVTAQNIEGELDVQEHIIEDVDQGLSRLQSRMESVMKKVGNLIDASSDRGKIIMIVVLMVILLVLIGFLL